MSTIRETITLTVARIRCDRCSETASPSYFAEECETASIASDEGWLVSDERDLCPECREQSDG